MEQLELAAAGGPEDDGEMEDVFGHMERDLGMAAKRACRRPETAAEQQVAVLPDHAHQQGLGAPPAKRKRLVGKQAPCAQETVIPASLEGLELRLLRVGEAPRFRPSETGGLVHSCSSSNAIVRFWPNTLTWCTEGPDGEAVEVMLSAPMAACGEGDLLGEQVAE